MLGGSLFLFGTMFKNHEDDVKEDDEEEEDSKIVQNEISEDDDIETENEVVEEIAETDTSIELIETVSSTVEVKDSNSVNVSNQVEDFPELRDEETDISLVRASQTSSEDCNDPLSEDVESG